MGQDVISRLVLRIGRKARRNEDFSQEAVDRYNQKEKDGDRRRLQRSGNHPQMRPYGAPRRKDDLNELGEREYSIFSEATTLTDSIKPVDRRRLDSKAADPAEVMHNLAYQDSQESLIDADILNALRNPNISSARRSQLLGFIISPEDEARIALLPEELWQRIASFLNPLERANLAFSSKTLLAKLGSTPFVNLRRPSNRIHRSYFLQQFDYRMPDYLFCFQCMAYHLRTQCGHETFKFAIFNNPLFDCPSVKKSRMPRMRLTYAREFPYAFVQLAIRAARYGSDYGIRPETLDRRWKCSVSGWSHRTRHMVHNKHLLMRVVSSITAVPAAIATETTYRHLLYDREDYAPYFSVCAHWRDGELMKVCKCALSHVPSPPDPYHKQLQRGLKVSRAAARPNFLVSGCDMCRPARRCPECPTEYLVEIQMKEDPNDKLNPFKHSIIITRWSDLGDGSDPLGSAEWRTINGLELPVPEGEDASEKGYKSFENVGRRAVGGIFESAISGEIPGQRLISLNPKNKKLGEEGNGWY